MALWGLAEGSRTGCEYYINSQGRHTCGVPEKGELGFAAFMIGIFLWVFAVAGLRVRLLFAPAWWPALGTTVGALVALVVVGIHGLTSGFAITLSVGSVSAAIVLWGFRRIAIK
ncbi:hypothetical protein GCM10010411_67610 [Actinomadura fulvescens]|uniref:Integral membrane protein n=1 Tax=Actinomadura fulvescens TaxID=46160 RepID=A0ABP6CL68_9ACTN